MTIMQSMLDETSEWEDELESISRTLKDAFGENFERASIYQKLFLLENTACCMRLDTDCLRLDIKWQTGNIGDIEITDLEFPEYLEDAQEAMQLIQELTLAISRDVTFHNLAIGGLC